MSALQQSAMWLLKQIRFQKLNVAANPSHIMGCLIFNLGSYNLWITDWYELRQKPLATFSIVNLKDQMVKISALFGTLD